MQEKRIYFAGSISGGRGDLALYQKIIAYLGNFGRVLTEHIGDASLAATGESGVTAADIYRRDLAWLESADVVVAEVTTPSLGVGYEVATAEKLAKPVLCLFRSGSDQRLSAMLAGNARLVVRTYQDWSDIPDLIDEYISAGSEGSGVDPA